MRELLALLAAILSCMASRAINSTKDWLAFVELCLDGEYELAERLAKRVAARRAARKKAAGK